VAREAFVRLQEQIHTCTDCPRLIDWCQEVAATKKKQYRDWTYWGKPVAGFGDPEARLVLLGLAPGAHGANRTGRVFTGDESGKWLYGALYEFGFSSQPIATGADDGLVLTDAYINNIVRCAPPQNKPTTQEIAMCRQHLDAEFALLSHRKVVIALGQLAFKQYLLYMKEAGRDIKGVTFAHGAEYSFGDDLPVLLASFHPSQQNTFTGKLTREMWHAIFARAKELIG